MKLEEAVELLEELMDRYGLLDAGWTYGFEKVTRQKRNHELFGICCHDQKVILISAAYVARAHSSEVKETVLHEIAHALVGPDHDHDGVWSACARRIGSEGTRIRERRTQSDVIHLGYEEKK